MRWTVSVDGAESALHIGEIMYKRGGQFRWILITMGIGFFLFGWMYTYQIIKVLELDTFMTLVWSLLMAGGPTLLFAMIVPSTPLSMAVGRVMRKTWGQGFAVFAFIILFWYYVTLSNLWWTTQEGAIKNGYENKQTMIGIIGFILVPGLIVLPMTAAQELATLQQATAVKKYEMEIEAEYRFWMMQKLRTLFLMKTIQYS